MASSRTGRAPCGTRHHAGPGQLAGGSGAFLWAWFPGGAGAIIRPGRLVGGLTSAPAIGHPGRQGPGSQCPSVPVRLFAVPYVPASSCRDGVVRAVPASAAYGAFRQEPFSPSFLYPRCWLCAPPAAQQAGPGHGGPHRPRRSAGTKKDVHRHGDRRTSCFTDAARGIRTACRAGKRWPRNRRPARRHCSTGHGSGSWPGSCARRTWA